MKKSPMSRSSNSSGNRTINAALHRCVLLASALYLVPIHAIAEGELHVYNWGDYINPEVLDRFSEETGIKVTLDTYGSNEEMLAKIQAGATG